MITILRDNKVVGTLDEIGRMSSSDMQLAQLFNNWQAHGIQTLAPPEKEPANTNGALADATVTVYPGRDTLGIVAVELERAGYTLRF